MVFGHDRRKSGFRHLPHQLEMVERSLGDRRAAVHMRIDGAFQDRIDAGFSGRGDSLLHRHRRQPFRSAPGIG
jgi:hypothetical protein